MIESNDNLAQRQRTPPSIGQEAPSRRLLVGVQFRRAAGIIYDFEAGGLALRHDQRVVVEAERGEEIGWVVGGPEEREPFTDGPVRRVLRVATADDLSRDVHHAGLEREALRFAASRVRESDLPMKMVATEWSHSGEKITFYFSSEERPDFRDLVKELAQRYRSRIEMRHVSPRDETKIIGALGPCGRETCCSSWLRAFSPVTIQMAKDQGLAISPQKVAGVCGRLMCCLAFEQETYAELRRKLPRYGRNVQTPKGRGRVVDVLTLRGRVRVQLEEGGYAEFPASDVSGGGKAQVADGTDAKAVESASAPIAPASAATSARGDSKPRSVAAAPPAHTERQERPNRPERPAKKQETRPAAGDEKRGTPGDSRQDAKPKQAKQEHAKQQERRPKASSARATSNTSKVPPGDGPAAVEAGAASPKSRRSRDHRRKRSKPTPAAAAPSNAAPATVASADTATSPTAGKPKAAPAAPKMEPGETPRRAGGRRPRRPKRSGGDTPN